MCPVKAFGKNDRQSACSQTFGFRIEDRRCSFNRFNKIIYAVKAAGLFADTIVSHVIAIASEFTVEQPIGCCFHRNTAPECQITVLFPAEQPVVGNDSLRKFCCREIRMGKINRMFVRDVVYDANPVRFLTDGRYYPVTVPKSRPHGAVFASTAGVIGKYIGFAVQRRIPQMLLIAIYTRLKAGSSMEPFIE